MSREQLIESQDRDTGEAATATAESDHGLPPPLHARAITLGPGDSAALKELLIAHPELSTKLLAFASRHMGLSATQRAISAAERERAGGEGEGDKAAQTAEVAAPEGGDAGPPSIVVISARTYNRAHAHYVAVFNTATNNSCVGADGQLDPVAVWHWQKAHGIPNDGRVGPQTSGTARAQARPATGEAKAEAAVDAPVAVDAPAAAPAVAEAPKAVEAKAIEAKPEVKSEAKSEAKIEPKHVEVPKPVEAPKPAEAPAPVEAATPDAAATAAPATTAPTTATATPSSPDNARAAGPEPTSTGAPGSTGASASPGPVAKPAPPQRPDNGGPGSLARRALAAHGTADQAFTYLVSDNDGTLDRNLNDYGNVDEQRALLDGVITAGVDVVHVRRAFHAFWHIQLAGVAATSTQAARDWPVASLQAIHHQLKLLPDHDARNGVWKSLSFTRTQNGAARGWWDKAGGISIGTDAWNRTDIERANGYYEQLFEPAGVGAKALHVRGGERLTAGDQIAIDRGKPSHEVSAVKAVNGDNYELTTALTHDHTAGAVVDLAQGGGMRQMSWLDYTVRHEIAHSLDGGAINTKGFYALGGWGGGSFRDWVGAMGSEAWTTSDNTPINDEDRTSIGAGLMSALGQSKSPFDMFRGWDPPHPIMKYERKNVPVINAALKALRLGDGFYEVPTQLHAANGKRFSYSPMYSQFQYCSEKALTDRVSNYALAAPAEFFAEAYAAYYEEAGKPGVTEADYGRLIRSSEQRDWLRAHVHERGHGPAGTGAAKALPGAAPDQEQGAKQDGLRRGRESGVSGL